MSLAILPAELIIEILSFAVDTHPIPSYILCVNTAFSKICQPLLHTHLYFRSARQLELFSQDSLALTCLPRSLAVDFAGGYVSYTVFTYLQRIFMKCGRANNADGWPLSLKVLRLRLNSHVSDPYLESIHEALSLANPEEFSWTGRDPAHHFSTAIVPKATIYLFKAISAWTHIQLITLTNLAFPASISPFIPYTPSLRKLYLGQTTFLPPFWVAALVCQEGMDKLEEVRLVDTYCESIWGWRIRKSNIETAAMELMGEEGVDRVRRLVICEGKTERIMGGDRLDGMGTLS